MRVPSFHQPATLRPEREASGKRITSFKLSGKARDYIKNVAAQRLTSMTQVVEEAIALERDMATALEPKLGALRGFAEHQHLDMSTNLAGVLVALVEEGLKVWDGDCCLPLSDEDR